MELEVIGKNKQEEQAFIQTLQRLSPVIEPPYAELLHNWRTALADTEYAVYVWQQTDAEPTQSFTERQKESHPTAHAANKATFIASAKAQSREFDRHLERIARESLAIRSSPSALAHICAWLHTADNSNAAEHDDRTEAPHSPSTNEGSWSSPLPPREGNAVPIGGHTLPPLPYPYNALEPHIDETTMRIHHDKHHQSYVDGLNKAEKKMEEARRKNNFELIRHWERELAFNGAGHYLHTLFWDVMSPAGGGKPSGPLAAQIEQDFGSYDAFKRQFSQAAEQVEGGGWAILVWSPRSHRLEILQAEKHQNLSQWDVIPLLPLDVWEHAYYLKHQNKRADYIDAWWNVVNWPYVEQRYAEASKLSWQPF